MKATHWTSLAAGASVLALGCFAAAPAVEAADLPGMMERSLSGTLSLYGGFTDADRDTVSANDSFDESYPLVGGSGKVDIPFNMNTSLQLDLDGVAAFTDGDESGAGPSESNNFGGGAVVGGHLNYREIDRFLIGMFGAAGVAAVNDTASTGQDPAVYMIGVEGQYYFGNNTLYAQLGLLDSEADNTNEALSDAFFVRGVWRHYFNAGRTKLEGEILYADGDQDDGDATPNKADVLGWGVKLEHHLRSWGPSGFMTGFAQYRGRDWDEGSSFNAGDADGHSFLFGVTFHFNQPSMLAAERTGVALDLPDMARLVSGATALD